MNAPKESTADVINEMKTEWIIARDLLKEAATVERRAKIGLTAVVAMHFNISLYDCTIGVHDCEKSPVSLCVYNNEEDPSLDTCLVCADPDQS